MKRFLNITTRKSLSKSNLFRKTPRFRLPRNTGRTRHKIYAFPGRTAEMKWALQKPTKGYYINIRLYFHFPERTKHKTQGKKNSTALYGTTGPGTDIRKRRDAPVTGGKVSQQHLSAKLDSPSRSQHKDSHISTKRQPHWSGGGGGETLKRKLQLATINYSHGGTQTISLPLFQKARISRRSDNFSTEQRLSITFSYALQKTK